MLTPKNKPCAECPFRRKSAPGYLGADKPENFVDTALHGEIPMPCHLEVDYEQDDWEETLDSVHQCTGHAIFLTNACKLPRNPEIKRLPRDTDLIFNFRHEFLKHHNRE